MSTFEEMLEDAQKRVRDAFTVPHPLLVTLAVNVEPFRVAMEQVQKSFAQLSEVMRPHVEAINKLARAWAQLEQRDNFPKVKRGRGGRRNRARARRRDRKVQ